MPPAGSSSNRGRLCHNRRYRQRVNSSHPDLAPNITAVVVKKGGGGGCFIATAASGSALAHEVVELRKFRDQVLARFAAGRWLIGQYYRYSPPAADFIRESVLLRSAARTALLPLAAAACLILRPAWLLGFAVLAALALLGYRRRRKEEI